MSRIEHLLSEVDRQSQKQAKLDDAGRARILMGRLFPEQRDFILDRSRNKAALCPRRSGKSFSVLTYAFGVCLTKPGAKVLIVCKVRKQARSVYWGEVKRMCSELELVHPHMILRNVALEAEFPNGSFINFTGADTQEEIEKFRGTSYDLVCIDECKSYSPSLLKELIQDVLRPALLDRLGTLVLIGTPGAVLSGAFYEITTCQPSKDFGVSHAFKKGRRTSGAWSVHKWTAADNTKMPHIWVEAQKDKEAFGWADDHPMWVREYCGQWVSDTDAMVFKFWENEERCAFPKVQAANSWGLSLEHTWQYLLGMDFGWYDDCSFVVAAFSDTDPNLYFVHAEKHPQMTVEQIAAKVKVLEDLFGEFSVRVADKGALGVTLVESLMRTYNIPIIAAKKGEKHDHIKLLNSDIETGRVKLERDGHAAPLAEEWLSLQWAGTDRKQEDPGCPNHCSDAALYLWRYAFHHLWQEKRNEPTRGSDAWWENKIREDKKRAMGSRDDEVKAWWQKVTLDDISWN